MSNVSYDLDTSGGLMPLIKALIKPPDEDANAQKPKKPQHPYYKRPGKGHNHDSCDACGEGGDLICCDRCPASFHLGCYDPPLDENDIPAGLWLCRECRASDAEKPSSARGSRAQSPADEKRTRSLRNNRANSAKKKVKEEEDEEKPLEELTPMEALVKAARIMNPRQFELPREMKVPCLFPGTEKESSKSSNAGGDGLPPLPARSCHVCRASCRAGPLLACDYCPLLYHQDCLDPPLTALPTGRWMCPNHVEQYIDWKLVNSVSATERVALWDKFAGPVDQHAIKIDFIRRARAANPRFRVKVPAGVRGRAVVPAMVRHHYRQPPPLMPSRREFVRCRTVLNRLKHDPEYNVEDEEDSLAPKHQICLNMSCPQYRDEGPCPHAGRSTLPPADDQDAENDLKAITGTPHMETDKQSESGSDLSDSDMEYLTASVKKRRVSPPPPGKLTLKDGEDVQELLKMASRQLRQLDSRLVTLLAWQRLHQVSWGEQCCGPWSCAGAGRAVRAAVCRSVAGARLGAGGRRLPSALLSAADRRRIAAAVWGAPPAPARARRPPPPARAPPALRHYVRATLSALDHRPYDGQCVGMRGSVLRVGTDAACGLRLDGCRRAAPTHATIFRDEVTGHFELINYAEWGTVVNGVVYACDVGAYPPPVYHLGDSGKPLTIKDDLTEPMGDEGPCRCKGSVPPTVGAWEGSALLTHGALLSFGCLQYVFSITDCLQLDNEDETA